MGNPVLHRLDFCNHLGFTGFGIAKLDDEKKKEN